MHNRIFIAQTIYKSLQKWVYLMKNIGTNRLYFIGSIVQVVIATVVSQFQSRKIKQYAKEIKLNQIGLFVFVFMLSMLQTIMLKRDRQSDY